MALRQPQPDGADDPAGLMADTREGGCLCGAVRYTVQWPPAATVTCSCRHCQKQAGSALSVVLVFSRDALSVEGDLKTYVDFGTSGQDIFRRFCPACGSPVLTDTPRAERQGIIFVKGGTLDEVADLEPTAHYWQESAQPWMRYPDDAKLIERE